MTKEVVYIVVPVEYMAMCSTWYN